MADLNALIAQGIQFAAPINPMDQFAKMQAMQQGQQANQLNQMKMQEYQRGMEETNAMRKLDPTSPTYISDITRISPEKGFAFAKLQQEAGAAKLKQQTEQSALVDSKLKQSRQFLDNVTTPEQYLAWHEANHADPVLGPLLSSRGVTAESARAQIDKALSQPGGFEQMLNQSKLGVEKFAEMNKPTLTPQTLGGTVRMLATPGLGGASSVVPGSTGDITNTPFQTETLNVAKGNLAVNQGRLGIEKAGLGIRAIQADPYNISGVQAAFPIPGAAVSGTPSPIEKQPSGTPVIQNVSAAMKAGLTGEDLLTHLPSNLANQVRAIGEGREPSPASRSLTSPAGRQLMDMVNAAYPTYDAKQYSTMGTAEKAFTSGKKGDTTRSLNVAVDHLGTLQQVSDALQNGDTRLFNQAGNFIALQTGNPAPTDFNAVKRIVADEITKAVLGSAGALGDRKSVDETISSANSPAQLKSVIDKYKQLMGGQLNGIEQQYTASTGKKDFRNRFLTPTTQAAIGNTATAPASSGGHPSDIQAIIDAQKGK